jgi:hypothetical protein
LRGCRKLGKFGALAQLRDGELELAGAGVPAPGAVAVSVGGAILGALSTLGSDQLGDLGLHQLLGHPPQRLAHRVDAVAFHEPANDFLGRHPLLLGHRGALLSSNLGTSDDHGRRGGRNYLVPSGAVLHHVKGRDRFVAEAVGMACSAV